jgi:hypothetical protein
MSKHIEHTPLYLQVQMLSSVIFVTNQTSQSNQYLLSLG